MTVTAHMLFVASGFAVTALAAARLARGGGSDPFATSWGRALVWVAAAGVAYQVFKLETWLPFLGEAALPPSALSPSEPQNASKSVTVECPRGTKYVAYWAASQKASVFASPKTAYASFENSGVATVVAGTATLRLACPAAYRVPYAGVLPKHVHYRFVGYDGIMSRVHTRKLAC